MTPVRLPRWLHQAASTAAAQSGLSLNKFMVAAIAQSVSDASPTTEPTASATSYEATIQFTLPAGRKADEEARAVADLITAATITTRAEMTSTRLVRTTALLPRTPP